MSDYISFVALVLSEEMGVANNLVLLLNDEDQLIGSTVRELTRVKTLMENAFFLSREGLWDTHLARIKSVFFEAEKVVEEIIFKEQQRRRSNKDMILGFFKRHVRILFSLRTTRHECDENRRLQEINESIKNISLSSPLLLRMNGERSISQDIILGRARRPLHPPAEEEEEEEEEERRSDQECLEFLMAKAGVDVARGYPDELIDPANIIVKRCHRRRSFLTAIGGILWSRMQTATEWLDVAKKVQQGNLGLLDLFEMCMDDLPPPLLCCFLHFQYFLGKSVMDAKTIIRLWVAEGFIQPTEEKTAEEVAEIYLEELIHRNMVQIVSMNDVVGGVETCRMNNIFKQLEFPRFFWEFSRRSIVKIKPLSPQPIHFDGHDTLGNKVALHCPGYITTLSKSKMHKLRYLNIHHSGGDDLKYIRYLRRLQTLSIDFRCGFDTQANKVMIDLSQIRKLRHLILLHKSHPNENFSLIGLEAAKYLQTLEVQAGDWIERALDRLTNLRTLKIRGCKDSHGEALKNSLIKLTLLTTLHLIGEGGFPGMRTLSSLIHLIELEMGNPLSYCHLNETNVLPPNLKKLTLWRCNMGDYPMRLLGNLHDLRCLQLYEDRSHLVDDEEWHMGPGDFPELQVLELVGVERVVEWIIDEGALPHLRQLSIVGCRKLKKLPNGLKHISTLRRLELSKSFEERVKRDTGEDWNEIKHVPKIDATYMDLDINRNLLLL